MIPGLSDAELERILAGTDTADTNEGPVIKDQPQLAELLRGRGVACVTGRGLGFGVGAGPHGRPAERR